MKGGIFGMEFTLFYQGKLKAKRDINNKQFIRREFHNQFLTLWGYDEMRRMKDGFIKYEFKEQWQIKGFKFLPLVTNYNKNVVQLNIFILWPEPPGSIVINRGDIDNRLKTLLDALRIPHNADEIPKRDFPGENETPFYCLLEDDKLISKVSITTAHLLYPLEPDEVKLFINIKVKSTLMDFEGKAYASAY